MTEERILQKLERARLGASLTAPKQLSDLIQNGGQTTLTSVDDDVLLKYESRVLRDRNFKENMRREMKKQQMKKQ